MTRTERDAVKGMSLLHKILLPFFLILSTLGVGATIISVLLISEAISKTADERLSAFQEVIFREIKKQEILLATYADILDHSLTNTPAKGALTIPTKLKSSLLGSKIMASLYRVGSGMDSDNPTLHDLLQQALLSGQLRYRFITDLGPTPTLAVAAPVHQGGDTRPILLLQTPMDHVFLAKLSAPFNAKAFLFSIDGKVLAGSERNHQHPVLSPGELEQILSGKRVFKTENTLFPQRHLYSAVPLGTTDIILLSLELPMTDLRTLVKTMATGSVAAITLALLLGGFVYYRLIRRITAPARELLNATRAVGDGNLDYRIIKVSNDELGQVADAFNSMMEQLGVVYSEKFMQQHQLTQAHEELKFKEIVEQKNREIERSNQELRTHIRELSALFQLNQAIIATLDLNLLFERIVQVLREVLHCEGLVLLLYNPGAEELEVRKSAGIDAEVLKGISFRLDEGITGLAARTQELVYIHDVAVDTRSLNSKGRTVLRGSMVSAPLAVKNRLLGLLNLHKKAVGAFSESEIKLIQTIVNQAAIAIENAQLYEKTRTLSNTDELTTLANRRYFQEILEREVAQAMRYGSSFSIIMADIDHFKRYNDTHGHLRGDTVLKKVAALMLQSTRGIDLVARFGGEEFVILLPKTCKEGAWAAAEKLRHCIAAETFAGADRSQPDGRLTLSLGIAEYPSDSKDIYELIDLADRALYQAKERGRNNTSAWNDRNPPLPDLFSPAAEQSSV